MQFELKQVEHYCDGVKAAVFMIVNDTADAFLKKYLTLYNHHNGYYSHGFEMLENDHKKHCGSL